MLIAIPNGELYSVYKDKIIDASKNKGYAFRYNFSRSPYFKELPKNPSRVKILYKDNRLAEKDLLGFYLEKRGK